MRVTDAASSWGGETARAYAAHRRDLPDDAAADLACALGLTPTSTLVDLGCGTGQLAVPLSTHCGHVLAVDPEPDMLAQLQLRSVPSVSTRLGNDRTLREEPPRADALVVGNALHWMDEAALLSSARRWLPPGGGIAVVTQGPPLWLGDAAWQRQLRDVVESVIGPVTTDCGTNVDALDRRQGLLESAGISTQVLTWRHDRHVSTAWIVGHMASATSPAVAARLAPAITDVLGAEELFVETSSTVALVGRR